MPDSPALLRIAVVGGGVAGLAAAQRLHRDLPGAEVTVFESAPRLGGSLLTAEVGGVVVDVGAEAMLNRRPEAVGLAREIGLADDLVHPATTSANLWTRGHLVPMPRTMMGVPLDLRGLDGIISAKGLARAAMDTVLPATELGDRDISVGDLVEERLGREVVDRLVEPLLGGVYAGHARMLSARAAVPQMVALLERDRSLVRAAAAATTPPDPANDVPVFAGLRGESAGCRRSWPGPRPPRCARARPCVTWPGARAAAGTSSSARRMRPRWCRWTPWCWRPPPAPRRGC